MNVKRLRKLNVVAMVLIIVAMLVACGAPESQDNTNTEGANSGGIPAMVDSVAVERIDNQNYAVIRGNYPDACTQISSVAQVVEGDTFNITLLTKKPDDLMCAMVLTPFTVNILLTTGGLMPGEYSIVVNEGPSATITLE